jgi:uncharacterized protein (DUF2164 family)
MKKNNAIKLTPAKKDEMVLAIRNYFSKEREEEMGNLAAVLLLEFIIQELAPEFYNHGVQDSYRCMQDMIEDLLAIQK